MKNTEKLKILQDNHFAKWLEMRQIVENEISDKQSVFCLCGRLATGLHESHCSKFCNKVTSETLKRLDYLLTPKTYRRNAKM